MKTWLRIPTNSDIDVHLAQWLVWAARKLADLDIGIHISNRGPDRARNEIIAAFLKSTATTLWLVDRDVVPMAPKPVILSFLTSAHPALSGVTDLFDGKLAWPQVYQRQAQGAYTTVSRAKWPRDEFLRADAVSAGCLCLQRSLLENMPAPWFEFPDGPEGIGEDLHFCHKIGGVVVHPRMYCRHYKTVDLAGVRLLSELVKDRIADAQAPQH